MRECLPTGHTARLVQKDCTRQSPRRRLVCLVLATAGAGLGGWARSCGDGSDSDGAPRRNGQGRKAAHGPAPGAGRSTIFRSKEPSGRQRPRHWARARTGGGQRCANLRRYWRRSPAAARRASSGSRTSAPNRGARLDQGGATGREDSGKGNDSRRRTAARLGWDTVGQWPHLGGTRTECRHSGRVTRW